jgi:hypothetical protein
MPEPYRRYLPAAAGAALLLFAYLTLPAITACKKQYVQHVLAVLVVCGDLIQRTVA